MAQTGLYVWTGDCDNAYLRWVKAASASVCDAR